MAFTPCSSAEEGAARIIDFLLDRPDPLPTDVRDQLREFVKPANAVTGTSISFTIAYAVELANASHKTRGDIPGSFLEIVAGCAAYCLRHSIDNLAGPRGDGIMQALRRDSGEETSPGLAWPDPEDDPDPWARFVPPAD
jgi:hypothetical protein